MDSRLESEFIAEAVSEYLEVFEGELSGLAVEALKRFSRWVAIMEGLREFRRQERQREADQGLRGLYAREIKEGRRIRRGYKEQT